MANSLLISGYASAAKSSNQERWRPIPGYEGIYEASNFGRIRTAPGKTTTSARYSRRVWKQRIIKGRGNSPCGYRASLWKDGSVTDWLVHRLVAMAWCDGYSTELTVNHKNGNRFDNRAENLEWVTLRENINHAYDTGLQSSNAPVLLVSSCGVLRFRSTSEASRSIGRNPGYVSGQIKRGGCITGVDGRCYVSEL